MFSSCERANGFFTLRIHMRGKVAKKITSRFVRRLCPSRQMQKIDKLLLARIARMRRCREFSWRLGICALFRFACTKCAKSRCIRYAHHYLNPQTSFVIVAATVVLWSAPV
jgi:hypothetical protein